MTLQDVLDKMDTWVDTEREQLVPVLKMLTPLSTKELDNFELGYYGVPPDERAYADFCQKQNALIKQLIQLEVSAVGRAVRAALGLPELTLQSVVV